MPDASGCHFAVVAPPTLGHINPLIALAHALRRRGHRCTLIHHAGAKRLVSGEALSFAAIDDDDGAGPLDAYLALLGRADGPMGLRRMIRATARMTGALLDGGPAAIARIGADAVLADMAEPAGALLARHMGLPCVATVTGLPLMGEPDVPPPYLDWPYVPGGAGRFRNQGGYRVAQLLMRPIAQVLEARAREWGLTSPGLPAFHVAQCPAGFDFPRRRLPPHFHYGAPWRLPLREAVDLPDDGRPLIFCSLGTLQGERSRVFAKITAACASVGARAVVAHGGGLGDAAAAALPGDPIVRAWWPQRAVLARCRAAVLHGGFNTVLDAIAAGVPIVAMPIAFEQPAIAARIEWTGIGRILPIRRASQSALARAIGAVLNDPRYGEAASRLGETIAGRDGAAEAAATISAALSGAAPATRAAETMAFPG